MIELKPPMQLTVTNFPSMTGHEQLIFLAGSIEMGKAVGWQTWIANDLANEEVVLFNPRRDHWDASWKQSIENPQFSEQVTWELDHIERADMVVFYFDPQTMSPITLMELGYVLGCNNMAKIFVCCPDGFWRKGNVEVMCNRNEIQVFNDYIELIEAIKDFL